MDGKVELSFQFVPFLLFMGGVQVMSLQLLLSHCCLFFKDHFLLGRAVSLGSDYLRTIGSKEKIPIPVVCPKSQRTHSKSTGSSLTRGANHHQAKPDNN